MNPKDYHRRLTELFTSALDLDAKARSDFLDQACKDNPTLREEVEALIYRNNHNLDFMEEAAVDFDFADKAKEAFASHSTTIDEIDQFRVIKLLGQGAMGKVYLAQHQSTDALVAIKVLHPTLVDRRSIGRFEREAKILGRLRHTGIAQIYDAKSIDLGIGSQPIFVMEYIDGLPLIDYADKAQLTTNERLDLISQIAIAVQHAHDCGIIHRDLKPDNILVSEGGNPKILDFGIARVTNTDLQSTMQTETGQLLGTVHYMSPEQVNGDSSKVDARSDVYALGVLAHELLSGRLPYNLTKKTIPEALRIILDDEPTRLGGLNVTWRGDVEVVIHHALEKDPARRYQSAMEFSEDLHRILHHEPIYAKPASVLYRVHKFAYRNPGVAVGVLAAFLLLIIISSISTGAAYRIANARDEAVWSAYIAHINAAKSALDNGNLNELRRHLEQAPQSERNWEWRYLAHQADMSSLSILAHDYVTWRAKFVPKSDSIISVGGDGLVRLWNSKTGAELITMADHGEYSTISTACSSDGSRIATGSIDGTVLFRNAATLEIDARLNPKSSAIWAMCFTPDGTKLLAGNRDGSLAFFDTITGNKLSNLPPHSEWIRDVEISPDGSIIASCSLDDSIHLIDSETYKITSVLRADAGDVNAISFSNDSKRLVSASNDQTITVWDVKTSKVLKVFTGHKTRVNAVVFLKDNTQIASAGEDGSIILWDLNYSDPIITLAGHIGGVRYLDFQPENGQLASAGFDGTIKIWNVDDKTNSPYFDRNNVATTTALNMHDSRIAYTTPAGILKVDDWQKHQTIGQWTFIDDVIKRIRWSPNGDCVAICSFDTMNSVNLFDLQSGEVRWTITDAVFPEYAPDGSKIAVLKGSDILILDPLAGETLSTFSPNNVVRNIRFTPDSQMLILGGHNCITEIWDISTSQQVASLTGHTQPISDVAVSSKHGVIFTASADRTIRLWDLKSGESLGIYAAHDSSVERLALNPDETRLASASFQGKVALWSLDTGDQLISISTDGTPKSLEFSHDGSVLHWVGAKENDDGRHTTYWWNGAQ